MNPADLAGAYDRAMLPPLYGSLQWIDHDEGSYLRRNCACVAYVVRDGQRWRTHIAFDGHAHGGHAATREQGRQWVERWFRGRAAAPWGIQEALRRAQENGRHG